MNRPADHASRMERALLAFDGLSTGDAFGERFFGDPDRAERQIVERALPAAPWTYTDDTVMALGIVEVLDRFGAIEQDALARVFARRYGAEPNRGYGGAAHALPLVGGDVDDVGSGANDTEEVVEGRACGHGAASERSPSPIPPTSRPPVSLARSSKSTQTTGRCALYL